MIDRQDLQQARDDLGRKLAALRRSRGLIQEALARQVHTTRSTLGMVERGRQVVDRIFWLQCDTLLDAQGELLAAYDAYRHLQSRFQAQQAEAAQRARWGAVPEAVMAAGEATGERYGKSATIDARRTGSTASARRRAAPHEPGRSQSSTR
ncbi:helix-turn-helix transcriptional regulator [Micromonospora chalcea]|uniref:helix-turn-helix transcriptional regulator n=1 Tax=Micromonospora chalcea TaxID=1874 RepID=UPI00157E0F0D|nr:helix-turn-helix transcriptional regulator [Micromonospora chalcea]